MIFAPLSMLRKNSQIKSKKHKLVPDLYWNNKLNWLGIDLMTDVNANNERRQNWF